MSSSSHIPTSGRITRGIDPKMLVTQAVAFVEKQLPVWRNDKTRILADAEEELNSQLCKFLDDRARDEFPMAIFHHEERQGNRRRVDMSVSPSSKAIEAAIYESIYVPFLVMEGKRLPTPGAAREREYLTGLKDRSGGVQRFRLCLHGKAHSIAVLIGYVQRENVKAWLKKINGWIRDLKSSREDDSCNWEDSDALGKLKNDGKKKACRCESKHLRISGLDAIVLIHLWICMPQKKQKKKSAKGIRR